jgi:hypothetical protein
MEQLGLHMRRHCQITYLIDMMRLNLEFKTRTWRLTKYKKTFKGGDLVDWLTKHLKLSREDAVAFGEVRAALRLEANHSIVLARPAHHQLLRAPFRK